jgi:hypothetical protein
MVVRLMREDRFCSAEVDVGRREVVDALVIANVIVVISKARTCRSRSPGR